MEQETPKTPGRLARFPLIKLRESRRGIWLGFPLIKIRVVGGGLLCRPGVSQISPTALLQS